MSFIYTWLPMMVVALVATVVIVIVMTYLRRVVPTNAVHIVQSGRKTVSYGKDRPAGNVYYAWPTWMPRLGVQVTSLPTSVYSLSLKDYPGYDKGRVPFLIDIIGFFRLDDPAIAAERIATFDELKNQMTGILQGAIRSILASSEIEAILEGRAQFGEMFTHAVDEQLKNWGITSVKTIELMDIRDAQGSQVIDNIMAKKKSLINSQSRIEVAANMQAAETREIEAKRQVELSRQEAEQQVGIRTAEKNQQVGIAQQTAEQQVKESMKVTAEKDMAVLQVKNVRSAEIAREVEVVAADQARQVTVINAEASKSAAITVAEGDLQKAILHAQGVEAEGKAKGAAEQASLMAPVNSQLVLAKEIGDNEGYQKYLISIRSVEASQAVGVEQAKALANADIKVISNVGTPPEGLSNVMDIFSAKGGLAIGAAIEAIASTPAGKAVTEKLGIHTNGSAQ